MSGRADGGASGSGGTGTLAPVDEVQVADRRIQAPYQREENPTTHGNALWIRDWKLSLGPKSSIPPGGVAPADSDPEKKTAFDLSDLDFSFDIQSSTQQHPAAVAKIRIYNVSNTILGKLQELVSVWLEAGYRKPSTQYGRIFSGEVVYYQYGRQNAVDTYVDIHAFQDEVPLDWAIVNTTLPAGHTKHDVLQAVADAMGVKLGQVTDLGDEKIPRARTLYAMARDVLRDIKETANAETFLGRDGRLNVLGRNETLTMKNVSVPLLNSETGLLGMPAVTIGKGVNIRCLLHPGILPGGQLRVTQADVDKVVALDTSRFPQQGFGIETHKANVQSTADGYYKVVTVAHKGEIRSNSWFTEVVTASFDPTEQPPALRPAA